MGKVFLSAELFVRGLVMTSLLRRRWLTNCLGLCISIAICGCAVGGKSMSIDSTSRMPWFGLELKERKRKTDGPAYRAVNLDKNSKSRVEAVGLDDVKTSDRDSVPKKSNAALPLSDPNVAGETKVADSSTDFDFR